MVNIQEFILRAQSQLADSCKNTISLSKIGYSTVSSYAEIRSRQQVMKTLKNNFYLNEEQGDVIVNHYSNLWGIPLQNLIIKTPTL